MMMCPRTPPPCPRVAAERGGGVAGEAPSSLQPGGTWLPSANVVSPYWVRYGNRTFLNKGKGPMTQLLANLDANVVTGDKEWSQRPNSFQRSLRVLISGTQIMHMNILHLQPHFRRNSTGTLLGVSEKIPGT